MDLLPVFKRQDIIFDRSVKAADDVYTFIFRPEAKIRWNAGQHALFTIKHEKISKAFRPFSLASTAEDGFIEISTRIGDKPSPFKQSLLNMKPGTRVSMRGPFGSFYLKNSRPTLLIAGGIGITPFKSILKSIDAGNGFVPEQTRLVYIDSAQAYLYRDDLDGMAGAHGIEIDYLSNRDDLAASITSFAREHGNDANYFIAGSPQMTKSVSSLLRDHNIRKQNIVKDAFFGL